MAYPREILVAAHRHSSNHRAELERSDIGGCFYCCLTCTAQQVEEWLQDEAGTALCPNCGVDSLVGSASGFPVANEQFLQAMHARWFG